MKIQIIEMTTGSDENNVLKKAWCLSRPVEKMNRVDLRMLKRLDLPVAEFPTAFIFVESTIIEREIIASMRNHVMWAQTSRVVDVLKFEVPEWYTHNDYEDRCRDQMTIESLDSRQDDYRTLLPLFSLTKYSLRVSARDAMHLLNYVMSLKNHAGFSHLEQMLYEFSQELISLIYNFGYDPKECGSFKTPKIMKELNSAESGIIGDTVVVASTIPIALRAHLVRHRNILVRDNLLQLMSNPEILEMNLREEVYVSISGLREDIIEVARKRSCWIAQYNLWSPLINKIDEIMGLTEHGLPCHEGICPFDKDARLRLENKDPNAPCPIHARLNDSPVTEKQRLHMIDQIADDARPDFWEHEVNSLGRVEE